MDKYEFNIKVEQIKKRVNEGDYETAMKIADGIDWRRVRNTNLLSMVAQVYEKNEEYGEAKNILLLAFERAPIGKRLLYKLTDLALKENNIEEAEDYYREFCDLAPEDSRQHLLRYMILKAKGAPAEQLIHSLEQYTSEELDERWMYELAFLYHQIGRGNDCVRLCDRIMLMFGIGKYVDKAMELKLQYAPLTSYQMDLVENRDKYEAKLRAVEERYSGDGYEDTPPQNDMVQEEEHGSAVIEEDVEAAQQEREEGVYQNGMTQAAYQTAAAEAEYDAAKEAYQADPRGIYEEAPKAYNQVGEEEHEEENIPTPSIDEVLAAKVKEAEEQENLAKELAKISPEEVETEDTMAQTRVLENIREVLPEAPVYTEDSAPVVEKVVPQEMEEPVETVPQTEDEELEIEELDEGEESPVTNHLMIEARTPEKGLEMALEALKKIHRELGTKQPVAKISGSKLNKKGIWAVADKLAGKDLIVEEAGDLSESVLRELNDFMDKDTSGVIVVLIDNPRQMEELHRHNPALARKFECIGAGDEPEEKDLDGVEAALQKQAEKETRIAREEAEKAAAEAAVTRAHEEAVQEPEEEDEDYPDYEEEYPEEESDMEPDDEEEMDIDEFAQYACKYASEIDCSITGKSMLALYERIEIMEEEGIPLTKKNAEDLIEEAADKADKPSLGKRITGLFSSKYDKNGLLILKVEHFID